MQESQSTFKNHEASIRNLETQMGQISRQLSERFQDTFPCDTIENPRKQCKAITTSSGKTSTPPQPTSSGIVGMLQMKRGRSLKQMNRFPWMTL